MNYEEKYKDAQKWIESIYTELSHDRQMEAEAFFPELRESEDEKIREWCISHFKECINVTKDNDEYKEYLSNKVIAWLEKQGETISWKPTEEQYKALNYAYNSCSDTETGNYYEGVLETLIEDLHKFEKQVQVKESMISQHESKMCKETDDYLTDKNEQKSKVYDSTDELIADALIEEVEDSDLNDIDKHNRITWIKSHRQSLNSWKPHIAQIEAFDNFYRSMGESGFLSPYDSNTQLLYSLLLELRKLKK